MSLSNLIRAAILGVLAWSSVYTLGETEQAVLTVFGKPDRADHVFLIGDVEQSHPGGSAADATRRVTTSNTTCNSRNDRGITISFKKSGGWESVGRDG